MAGPDGRELDMGTGFDSFAAASATAWYELNGPASEEAEAIRRNRRVLHNAMAQAGFANLPSEWWHYSIGDGSWSRAAGQPARYRGVFGEDEIPLG